MNGPVPASSPGLAATDRLSGWKDIATFLGKGVRTVQRWEKEFGLPVHRIGKDGGEIVLASKHEIEQWLETWTHRSSSGHPDDAHETGTPVAEPPAPVSPAPVATPPRAPSRERRAPRWWLALAGVLITTVVGAVAWRAASGRLPPGSPGVDPATQPERWAVEGDALLIYNAAGAELWRVALDEPVTNNSIAPEDAGWSATVAIADLDGDGPREVLVGPLGSARETRVRLRCFDADGTLRWTRTLDDRITVGPTTYTPPWLNHRFRMLNNPDGTKSVWTTFIHAMEFPTFLEQIGPRGDVISRYWSNGYVTAIRESTWNGRRVLLVGGVSNEHRGASFAVLDRAHPGGHAPAANPKYRCDDCPAGEPLGFVVIPPTPLGRIRGDGTGITDTWVNDGRGFVVQMFEGAPAGTTLLPGALYYTLDEDFTPVRLEVALSYEQMWDALHRAGRIDRAYSPAEERHMGTTLRWQDGTFVADTIPAASPR